MMKRIIRDRRLTPDEAAKYRSIRQQVQQELPELIARHHQRLEALEKIEKLLKQFKAVREETGLTLADISERSGVDRSAPSDLEDGDRSNPTVETLVRYAEALDMRLDVSLVDAASP